MPDHRRTLTRTDLPDELTAETLRGIPLAVLRPLSRPGNGVLSTQEQGAFDAALHEIMSETANRVSQQIGSSDWSALRRNLEREGRAAGARGRSRRVDEQLRRAAKRIDQQVGLAEALAPGVDWSFAETEATSGGGGSADSETEASTGTDTVADLEQNLTDQVELVQVMSEIADISKRTYALERQRDLQTTRGVFFGFVVSVAVLVAGWAPLVAAHDWEERGWVLALTVATCAVAGAVYALVRRRQVRDEPADEDQA